MRNSLTLRLVISSFFWVGATLLVTTILLVLLFRGHIEKRFDSSLQDHLEELVAASNISPAGEFTMTWQPTDPRFNRPHSGWYWEIKQSGRNVARSKSLWQDSLDIDQTSGEVAGIQKINGPENEALHALVQNIIFPQSKGSLLYIVSGPVSDVEADVRQFMLHVVISLTVLGIGLLLAIWFQVHFGLRPLQVLQKALGDIRQGREARLPKTFPSEVQPVVTELNALLDHNASLLERSRTQAGNLAHALKNPLTVIRNEAKSLNSSQGNTIQQQTDAMAASIDRHLSQARAAGSKGVLGSRTDVHKVISDLCYTMEQLYQQRDLEIKPVLLGDCWFRGETQDLEEMLGNLIDNACKWANHKVCITAQCTADHLVIFVEDDGTGIPEELRDYVLKRGRRLDEEIPGSGLGLDIVKDLAELYRGSLELDHSPLGGLLAHLNLPAVKLVRVT